MLEITKVTYIQHYYHTGDLDEGITISVLISCKFCRGCELSIVFGIYWNTESGDYFAPEFKCWNGMDTYQLINGWALAGLDIYPARQVVTSLTLAVSQSSSRSRSKIFLTLSFPLPASPPSHPCNIRPARYISSPG